jgi:hypothetical protein
MKKVKAVTIACGILILTSSLLAQVQSATRATTVATVGGKNISIVYGRPALRGRNMIGLAQPGTVWRLGMNEATEITSELPLIAGGKQLRAGKYSLWAKKTGETSWVLAFHPTIGVWGQPELRDGFVGEVPLRLEKAVQSAEQLSIVLTTSGKNVKVDIHWGDTKLVGTFRVV